jgi:hypothetical protein
MCRAVALERLRVTDLQQLHEVQGKLDEEISTCWDLRERLARQAT